MRILRSSTLQPGGFRAWRTPNDASLPPGPSLHLPTRSTGLAPIEPGPERSLQDSHSCPEWQHRQIKGQGCGQTSTHGPEWGEDFVPMLKAPPALPASLTALSSDQPQHCADALGRRASWGGTGMQDLTGWVGSSGRGGIYTDQGHWMTEAPEGDCGEKDSSGRGGLGKSCLHWTHLTSPASQLLSRARGCPAASGGLPRLPWSS